MSSRKVLVVLLPIIFAIIITMLWVIGYAFLTWPAPLYVELMRVTVWPITFLPVSLVFSVGVLLLISDRERPLSSASTPQTTVTQAQQAPQEAELQSRVFTHALYHLVTHWLAVVTLIALLIGVPGVLAAVSVSQCTPLSKWSLTYSIFAATLMSIYFLYRIEQFGAEVNSRLPREYVEKTRFLSRNRNVVLVLGAIVVLLAFCMDIYVVWGS